MIENNTQESESVVGRFDRHRRRFLKATLATGLAVGAVPEFLQPASAAHSGLVAYYPLDGRSGPVRDETGRRQGRTLGNVTRGAAGRVGAAFQFDGSDDGVEAPNSGGAFDLTSAWTVAAWVRPAARGSDYRNDPVVWKIARSNTNRDTFFLGWGASGSNRFRTGLERASDGTDFAVDSGTHSPGAWHHVVGSYDGDTLRVSVNGTAEGSSDIGDVTAYTGPAPLRVGNLLHSNHGSRGVFEGRIDEVRIYDRALSGSEIRVHERLGVCGLSPSSLTESVLDELVAVAEAGALRTVSNRVTGNLDVSSGTALFLFGDVAGNINAGGSDVVSCGATSNGNVDVGDLVGVNARIRGNLRAERTVTAFGDVAVNGSLTGSTGTAVVAAGSSLRVGGNMDVERLVVGSNAVVDVNGNLRCSARDIASSADVNVAGINNCA